MGAATPRWHRISWAVIGLALNNGNIKGDSDSESRQVVARRLALRSLVAALVPSDHLIEPGMRLSK